MFYLIEWIVLLYNIVFDIDYFVMIKLVWLRLIFINLFVVGIL